MKTYFFFLPFFASICFAASGLQSTRPVMRGDLEITPFFSSVEYTALDTSYLPSNNYGVQLETGISEDASLIFSYEYIDHSQNNAGPLHFISLGPKIRVFNEYIAICAPLGFFFGKNIPIKSTWQLHPVLFCTVPVHKYLQVNLSPELMIFLDPNIKNMTALNGGLGISNNFAEWSLKPAISYVFNGAEAEHSVSLNIGLTFTIPRIAARDSTQNVDK